MKDIIQLFPTSVYIEDNCLPENLLDEYETLVLNNKNVDGGSNWVSKLKNSLGVYNLVDDENFSEIIKFANDRVMHFNSVLDSKIEKIDCNYAWFNIYERGDYQETHHHGNSVYSGVFFLKTPEKSSPLILFSPAEHLDFFGFYNSTNEYNMNRYKVNPIRNRFVLFKSYLKHMVPQHESYEKRITLAFNF
jgi:uncharacterized protein (TIGR02466 family)